MIAQRGKALIGKAVLSVFIAAELAIYVIFNIMAGLNTPDPIYLKYSGVLLCLVVAVLFAVLSSAERDYVFVLCALAFTATSDLFILVLDKYYEIGVATFIIAQSIHFARLYYGRYKKAWISLAARAVVMVAVFIVMGVNNMLGLLVAECIIYITMLVGNVVDAIIVCNKGYKNVLFAVGLLLFFCCDICVGLHNFGSVLSVNLPIGLLRFAEIAIWAFYLPSQVLITCSAKKGGLLNGGVKNERKG